MRDHSPIDRCAECGCVTRMLVYEHGLDDNGDEHQAIWSEPVPHSRRECVAFQALEKEVWPRLF